MLTWGSICTRSWDPVGKQSTATQLSEKFQSYTTGEGNKVSEEKGGELRPGDAQLASEPVVSDAVKGFSSLATGRNWTCAIITGFPGCELPLSAEFSPLSTPSHCSEIWYSWSTNSKLHKLYTLLRQRIWFSLNPAFHDGNC